MPTSKHTMTDEMPDHAPRPRSPRRWIAVAGLVVVFAALGGATIYFSATSRSNRESAFKWRRHAQQSDKLLATRTHQLNVRSSALNRTAAELARSESDVSKLEARQRTLADEKAQVEDQRGAMVVQTSQLAALADEQRTCSDGLSRLLGAFAADDDETVNAEASGVGDACQQAEDDFAAFQERYGME